MELGMEIYAREAVELKKAPAQYPGPTSDQLNQKLWGRAVPNVQLMMSGWERWGRVIVGLCWAR